MVQMSEYLIKQTEDETIIRYELMNKNIWVVNKFSQGCGVGQSKKEAIKEAEVNRTYCNIGIPAFISELGSVYKFNNRPEVNSVPNGVKFIQGLLPHNLRAKYIIRVISDQNNPSTFVEIAMPLVPEMVPLRYWSDDKKGHYQQLTNCVYQFYVDKMRNILTKRQNIKLAEWQYNWYTKLQPRSVE